MAVQAAIDAEDPKMTGRYQRALRSWYIPHVDRHYAGSYLASLMWYVDKHGREPTPQELEQDDREGGWKVIP